MTRYYSIRSSIASEWRKGGLGNPVPRSQSIYCAKAVVVCSTSTFIPEIHPDVNTVGMASDATDVYDTITRSIMSRIPSTCLFNLQGGDRVHLSQDFPAITAPNDFPWSR